MQCDAAKIWLSDAPDADPRWSDHLASCASCRAEADRAAQLRRTMQTLPSVAAPAAVAGRLQQMAAATAARSLECDETLERLEPYREGLLNAEERFLVDDHLLWCEACAEALEAADALTTVLRALPQVEAPECIAERLVQARLPWWQRLWTAPAPSWSLRRLLQVSGAMAAAALLFAVMVNTPKPGQPVADNPTKDIPPVVQPTPVTDPPVVEPSVPDTAPNQVAVVLPAVPAQREKTPVVNEPAAGRHPEVDIIAALPMDPMVVPVAKALIPLAIHPDAMIQPRAVAPKDGPIEVKVGRRDDPIDRPPPPRPEKNVNATAREKLLEMNSEYALARSEEELASPQLIAAVVTRPDVSRPAGPAPTLTASPEEFSKTAASYLKKNNITPAPITVKSTHTPERIGGTVFEFPVGTDG